MRDGAAGGARRDDMPARVKTARRFIVGANWKCHGRTTSARAYAKEMGDAALPRDVDVYIAPSLLHLHGMREVKSQRKAWNGPAVHWGDIG